MAIHLLVSVIVVGLDGFHELSKCTFVLTRKKKKEKKKRKDGQCTTDTCIKINFPV